MSAGASGGRRGLSRFGAADRIVPPGAQSARSVGVMAAILAFFAVVALALALAAGRLAESWAGELAETATLQIFTDEPDVEDQARAALNVLRTTPGVRSVQVNLLALSCTVHYDPEVIPEHAWGDFLAGAASEAAAVLERILHDSYREIGNAELR